MLYIMMKIQRLLSAFIIITAIGILYDKYKQKYDPEPEKVQFDLIQRYLLNEPGFNRDNNKPLMWVFTDHEINSSHWEDFASRNTNNLNQPYIHMCIELIIKWCGESFNICLINSDSFDKLLKDWTINVNELSEPIRGRVIKLGLFRILHKYGGTCIPNSMLMMKDFKYYHDRYLGANGCYFGEFVSRDVTSNIKQTFPNNKLFGCTKKNENMKELCNYMEMIISTDNTGESNFVGNLDRFIFKLMNRNAINKIPGNLIGTKTVDGEIIIIDDLLGNSKINFDKAMCGIYLPADEIIKRHKFGWFARSNKVQILSGKKNVSKFFAICFNYPNY